MNHSIQVNGIFGVLKNNSNFKCLLMRREADISTELFLFFLAYNMQKFFFKSQCEK